MNHTDEEFAVLLRATFRAEAVEHVELLAEGLVELEGAAASGRRSELLDDMFREAHSLKGAAGAASQPRIAAICQSMESVLALWKRGETQPDAEGIDSVSSQLDAVIALLDPSDAPAAAKTEAAAIGSTHPEVISGVDEETPLPTESPKAMVRVSAGKVDRLMLQAEELLSIKLVQNRHASAAREIDAAARAWRKSWDGARADLAAVEQLSPQALRRVRALLEKTSIFALDLTSRAAALSAAAEQDRRHVGPLVDDMLAQVESVLMLPFSSVSVMFGKMVRDLARQEGKSVDLIITGADTELDRRVLERLKDPLLHAIRNAVGHGIEPTEYRIASGKASQGTVRIDVERFEDNKVSISVTDDGRGLDPTGIRDAAVSAGAASRERVESLDDMQCLSLVFEHGVSTNPIITDISGRGVGLDVARRNIESIEGTVAFESTPGAGSILRIVVPTALVTIRGVVVEVAGRPFVVPTTLLHRVLRIERSSVKIAANQPTTVVDGRPVPLVDLADLVGIVHAREVNPGVYMQAFILGGRDFRIAFTVDQILQEQDVLVKSLGPQLARVSSVSGATVLETGQVAPVFDTRGLIAAAHDLWKSGGAMRTDVAEEELPPSILIAEDSVTSRMLLRNTLTTAGFHVRTTCDGSEAFAALQSEHFDAVVSDVEMPNTNGFELTARIRADARFARLPVVLVTGRESPADRAHGIEVGANAYLAKSSFDKSSLLETLRRLT